ncbi:MAG: phenylalanine--tRNA ligase subunit beta [Spongiibacteraceae bacterium]|jgi:phenylalanyl-tRNA synthetase beta chain|nr:phenylalanine--tRNA ligase subunit beta [Spongiibacteraceae bacterium]
MKFNESWLRSWVNPSLDTAALAHQLTMAGLEVDAIEPVAGAFSGVVVGEILSVEQHPDADKLRVCQVAGGPEPVQVVCGAPNARPGIKVPFATIGAVLPGDFRIKKAKLRGVESFGMLCAADELQLSDDGGGLLELPSDAPVGADLRAYLDLDDRVIEIGLTPNRADCLSLRGIAREVAVLNRLPFQEQVIAPVAPQIDDRFPVSIEAAEDCPHYMGRVVRNVDPSRPSPAWLVERLRRCGLRSIDPIVDITNYVMLELGQPMHAFDLERLANGIVVRGARAGEELVTLDGQAVQLKAGDMVIADHEQPVALAGVMGGKGSSVSAETRHIFLESAFFAPERMAGRARAYGLHTDSSHRFERGVDFALQAQALERATQLVLEIVGGEPGPVVEVATEAMPTLEPIVLARSSIASMLCVEIAPAEVEAILQGLGMTVTAMEEGWEVTPPSWRFDVRIEADLLEELARIYGYDKLPVRPINADLPLQPAPETRTPVERLKRFLVARGYQEAITYSFIDPALQARLDPEVTPVALRNPISADMAVMRTTLWAGLLRTLSHNLNRQQSRARLFETGLRFVPDAAGLRQEPMLALLVTGQRFPESWTGGNERVDFFDLKGDVEAVLALAAISSDVIFERGSHPALHPGQTALLRRNGQTLGIVGALHPEIQRELELDEPVYLAELNLDLLVEGQLPSFTELSRFPAVRRDLAVLVDRKVAAQAVLDVVRQAAGEQLRDLRLFDVYEGKGIDPQRKSLALGLTFQHTSRTLAEDEVSDAVQQVVDALASQFEATLRN